MSDDGFDDSFEQLLNGSNGPDKDLFDRLFCTDFEDEDILFDLSTNEDYPSLILNFNNYCIRQNQSHDFHFDYISGLVHVMQKLSQLDEPNILELWISSKKQMENCIIAKIFQLLPNCYIELCLPKFIDLSDVDMPDIKISFFEHLALNICRFVATLTPELFHGIEAFLFKQLMSVQSVCQMLSSDILCFTARFSKDKLCYQYCSVLMTISQHLTDSELPNTASLINRLLPFLQDLELEYLLKDYDLFAYSRFWRLLDIGRVIKELQIKEIIDKLMAHINEGKPLNKNILDVIQNIFTSSQLDDYTREKFFELFSENFFDSTDLELNAKFLNLMTALMPEEVNDYFIDKLCDKLDKTPIDNNWFEHYLTFLTRLAQTKGSYPAEKRMTLIISRFVIDIYNNSYNYIEKFHVFDALQDISTKTRNIGINVLKECLKNNTLRQEFKLYIKKLDSFQKLGERMSVNDKIKYLQSIESKLSGQKDFGTNEITSNCRQMSVTRVKQNGHNSVTNGSLSDDDSPPIDELIDAIGLTVKTLKEQSVFSCDQIEKIKSINDEFNDFVSKIND